MATDLTGLFQNNRRRESHSVTLTLPAVLEQANLREGKAVVTAPDATAIILGVLPAGLIITDMCVVVTDVMDAGITLKADLVDGATTTPVVAAAPLDAAGLTKSATADPVLTVLDTQLVAELSGPVSKGAVQIVINYTDYARATMSYLGEG